MQISTTNVKYCYYSSFVTTVLTIITFLIAINTLPLSGPFCTSDCYVYPYTDIAPRFPRDYYWMYPAMLLAIAVVFLITSIHYYARDDKKWFSHLSMIFASISSAIFLVDYFLQISIIQPSLLNGEFDGISIFTQFNPHGIYIVLEELAFLLLSLSLLLTSFVFSKSRRAAAIKIIFILNLVLNITALVGYTVAYGVLREYRFEVATISLNWITLIVSGVLMILLFKKEMKSLSV